MAEVKEKKTRGGQSGNQNAKGHGAPLKNQNAAGHGAPKENKNAETHGAYSAIKLENLSDEERAYIESVTLNAETNMLYEYGLLLAKERDLFKKIKFYENSEIDFHTDKIITTTTPKCEGEVEQTFKSSSFERMMRLEAELNKTHGRILKLLDSMRAYEFDTDKFDLDNRRHEFNKQRVKGEYKYNPDTGEIDDSYDYENEESPESI